MVPAGASQKGAGDADRRGRERAGAAAESGTGMANDAKAVCGVQVGGWHLIRETSAGKVK